MHECTWVAFQTVVIFSSFQVYLLYTKLQKRSLIFATCCILHDEGRDHYMSLPLRTRSQWVALLHLHRSDSKNSRITCEYQILWFMLLGPSKLWWSEKVTLWWKSQEGEVQEKEGKQFNLLFPICQGVVIFPVNRSVTDLWALSAHTDTGSSSTSWSHRNTGHWPNNVQEPRPFREVEVSHLKSPWSAVKLMVVGVPVKLGSPDCAPVSCACNWCYKFEVCCDSRSLNFTAVVAFPF